MASLGRTGLVPESVRRLRTTDVTDAQLIARSVRVRLTLTATCMLFRFVSLSLNVWEMALRPEKLLSRRNSEVEH